MIMDTDKKNNLRDGITTGSCAAASAAAAIETYFGSPPERVTIDLPDSSGTILINIHKIVVHFSNGEDKCISAIVIKDAGDDPDITNKAEIGVEISVKPGASNNIVIKGGKGVGTVTRPGLPVQQGEPAINPVPLKMIEHEIRRRLPGDKNFFVSVTVFIKDGKILASKTLNPRLGIIGGLSVLGTTGIVKPYSAKSYRDTIDICLKSARHNNQKVCVLSTGRKSERLTQGIYPELDEKCFVQTADFFSYALKKAIETGFKHIILSCFFGKLCKWAMNMPYTHARSGLIDFKYLSQLALDNGCSKEFSEFVKTANNARHIFESGFKDKELFIELMGKTAINNASNMSDHKASITICLFDYPETLYKKWELKNSNEE